MHICAYTTRPQKSLPNQTLQTDEAQLISIGPWYRLAANIGASAGQVLTLLET